MSERRARFQFSLRSIMVLVAAIAVFLSLNRTILVVAGPVVLVGVYALAGMVAGVLVLGAILMLAFAAVTEILRYLIFRVRDEPQRLSCNESPIVDDIGITNTGQLKDAPSTNQPAADR